MRLLNVDPEDSRVIFHKIDTDDTGLLDFDELETCFAEDVFTTFRSHLLDHYPSLEAGFSAGIDIMKELIDLYLAG